MVAISALACSTVAPGASLAIVGASLAAVAGLSLWLLKSGYKLRT